METRIEKYREYRRSIISGNEPVLKTQIETSLKTTSKESQTTPVENEVIFLKKISRREKLGSACYILFLLMIIIPLITFGIIVF